MLNAILSPQVELVVWKIAFDHRAFPLVSSPICPPVNTLLDDLPVTHAR